MPVQRGNTFEGRAKSKLLQPYVASCTVTKNFPTWQQAHDWEVATRKQLAAGIIPEEVSVGEERVTTIGAAIKQYLAANSVKSGDQEQLMVNYVRIGATLLKDVDYNWVERWVSYMKLTHHLAPSTIRKHVGALARCFDWLMRTEKSTLIRNPLRLLPVGYSLYNEHESAKLASQGKQVRTDEERDRRLEEGEEPEIRRILAGGKEENKQRALVLHHRAHLEGMFEVALETAMRMSEIYTLTRDQIDLERRTVFLDKTKNGDKRQVPLSSVALKTFEALVVGIESGKPVFPWYGGEAATKKEERQNRRVITRTLSQQYARIFAAAGCPDLTFHDLRHEATSRLFERTNLSDVEIAKITGHKRLEMLKRYANLRASNLAARLW